MDGCLLSHPIHPESLLLGFRDLPPSLPPIKGGSVWASARVRDVRFRFGAKESSFAKATHARPYACDSLRGRGDPILLTPFCSFEPCEARWGPV